MRLLFISICILLLYSCFPGAKENLHDKISIKVDTFSTQDVMAIQKFCDSASAPLFLLNHEGLTKISINNYFYDTLLIPIYGDCNAKIFICQPDKISYLVNGNDSLHVVSSDLVYTGKCDDYEIVLKNKRKDLYLKTLGFENGMDMIKYYLTIIADSSGNRIDISFPVSVNVK